MDQLTEHLIPGHGTLLEANPLSPPVLTVLILPGRARDPWLPTIRALTAIGHRVLLVELAGPVPDKAGLFGAILERFAVRGDVVVVAVACTTRYIDHVAVTSSSRDHMQLLGCVVVSPTHNSALLLNLPALLVFGEKDVKSRPFCERVVRTHVTGHVTSCVMIRGVRGGCEPIGKHEMWIKALKTFLTKIRFKA